MAKAEGRDPGTRYEYSDYGLILMGALIERITGDRIDVLLERDLFGPLALQETGFNPLYWGQDRGPAPFRLTSAAAPLATIAPTERSRGRGLIHGVVHDPIAHRLDGVAGHAGLFSSARDLAVFAELMRASGVLGEARVFDSDVLATFTRRQSTSRRHTLGWELAREDGPSGSLFRDQLRPHRFHRHVHLHRSRARPLCRPADQSPASECQRTSASGSASCDSQCSDRGDRSGLTDKHSF